MKIGHAPCAKCGLYAKNVRLTGWVMDAWDGGKWYECESGQFCIRCNEIWAWLHVPPEKDLPMPLAARELETVERGCK
jgi:hypothetical protein